MLASGSRMPRLRNGPAKAAKVGGTTCMRPWLGIPALALASQRLIAFGLPPLSVCICVMNTPNRLSSPNIWSTECIRPPHRATPEPTPPPPNSLPNQPPTLEVTLPSADSALPGSAVIAANPLEMSPPSAAGQPPNTILTRPPASCARPLNSPAVRFSPTDSMTVLGDLMPKKCLTAFTTGSTTTRLIQLPMPLMAVEIPDSIPLIMAPPRMVQPRTTATPHDAIWPGSRENQPARLVQAAPRAREMAPTTLPHHRCTVEVTDEAMPPMKLAMELNTDLTMCSIAPTVLVMKFLIWVQYRITSTTARPTGPVRMPTISGQFRDSQPISVLKMPGIVTVKNWVNGPANQRTTASTASLTPLNAASTITRKVRDRVHSR